MTPQETQERPAPPGGPRRLDAYLVARGLFASRAQAQAAILAGQVEVEGLAHPKPGDRVRGEPQVRLRAREPFVSRGGRKLQAALERWPVAVQGAVAADLGASTGGFTHCLLVYGARRVYAVDVGRGQLAASLAQDPRVVVRDRTNARYLTPADFPERLNLVTADLSFISLRLVLPSVAQLLRPGGQAVVLVKPQFEAGRERVRRGVVRDPQVHQEVLRQVWRAAQGAGLVPLDAMASPLLGPEGNAEFLLWLWRPGPGGDAPAFVARPIEEAVARAVEEAHRLMHRG